jgi:glucose-1-phosphate adenylyltransferase
MMGSDFYQTLDQLADAVYPKVGVGERCKIERAILDKNCRIGNDVCIRGNENLPYTDTATYTIVDGVVIVKKGAVITDGTRIGDC